VSREGSAKVAVIGARGYVGAELHALLTEHPAVDIVRVPERDPAAAAAAGLDACFLCLPNGAAAPYVDAFTRASRSTCLIDLSSDHRFAAGWIYGQPERNRAGLRGARRVANPGCYATAAQLAIEPFRGLIEGTAHAFGVSGYTGAGTAPSPRNDPAILRDNVLPYALVDHVHEREVTAHLGHPVRLLPHVAPFARGLTVTVSLTLREPRAEGELRSILRARYEGEPLVTVTGDPPLARAAVGCHGVTVGGLAVAEDGRSAVVVAALDNLLGGAATQALRNMNLALGRDENEGVPS